MDKLTKLSQAIRLGATFHPQCFGAICQVDRDGNVTHTCAVGGALEAIGIPANGGSGINALCKRFDAYYILGDVMNRNDKNKWTREQIADWLEAQGL